MPSAANLKVLSIWTDGTEETLEIPGQMAL